MKNCPNCNLSVEEGAAFCPVCGAKIEEQPQQPPLDATPIDAVPPEVDPQQQSFYQQQAYQQSYQQQNNQQNNNQQFYNNPQQPYNNGGYQQRPQEYFKTTGLMVWSIINLVCCCLPLGVWSLILVVSLNKEPTYELAAKKYNQAKTICLIGTILGAVVEILYFAFYGLAIFASI